MVRRELLPEFPEDVVADDVHAAFRCAAAGWRVGFVKTGIVELRSPVSVAELVRHKYRKGSAFVAEIFRYLPKAPSFPAPFREMFLWRAAQVLLTPFAAVASAGGAVAIAHAGGPVWAGAEAVILAGTLAACAARPRWRAALGLAALLTAVLGAAILLHPLRVRRGSLPKIDARRRAAPELDPS